MIRLTLAILFFTVSSVNAKEPPGQYIGPADVDVKDFCITPSGSYVYAAAKNRISLYETRSGQLIDTLLCRTGVEIRSIALTSDSTRLIAGTDQGILLLHSLFDKEVDSVKLSDFPITSLTINAFNSRIASGTANGELILTDLGGSFMERSSPHDGIITDLEFSNDGALLLSSGLDGRIFITDLSNPDKSYNLIKEKTPCRDISINKDVSGLLASYDNGKVLKWRIRSDKSFVFERGFGHRGWTTGVIYYLDNYTWASCTSAGRVEINTYFNMHYVTRVKGVATRVRFVYGNEPELFLLVSVYKGGLLLLSAKNM